MRHSALVRHAYVVLAPFLALSDMPLDELRRRGQELLEAATVAGQMGDLDTAGQAIGRGFRVDREIRRRHAALSELREEAL